MVDINFVWERVYDDIRIIYGPHRWAGAFSCVWATDRHVIKLTKCPLREWRVTRILAGRDGPFSPIRSMQIVGCGSYGWISEAYIVGVIVQDRIEDPAGAIYGHDPSNGWNEPLPAARWFDGIDSWRQGDPARRNAVGGVWVDLGMIDIDKGTRVVHEAAADSVDGLMSLRRKD